MAKGYDKVAPVYDALKQAVFGHSTEHAQAELLQHIGAAQHVLIVGGGTGWLLEAIAERVGHPLDIVYVEMSGRMLAKAKRRAPGIHRVQYIAADILFFDPGQGFDIVITPFLFDNFTPEKGKQVFNHILQLLHPGGRWLFTDFYLKEKSAAWQKALLWLMYRFFRFCCRIEAKRLPDVHQWFMENGMHEEHRYLFYKGFICSAVYCRHEIVNNQEYHL